MKISKELKITGVIIKPSDIRQLAKKVYEEYESDESDDKRINFILKGNDGTQYESEDIKIFSDLDMDILNTRRIIEIKMTYCNYSNDKRISIKLNHIVEDYGWGNSISVSGSSELWVNGITKNFEDIISNWEKQVIWPHKYYWFLVIIFVIIFVGGLDLFYLNFLSKSEWGDIVFGFSLGISFWLASYLVDELKKLYPIVELRTGPEHTQVEAKKRKKVYAIISIGVIPLIISLVVELIKKFR